MTNDININGATYEDVPAVDLPTADGSTARYTDVSDSTVSADTLATNTVAYSSDGTRLTGTMAGGGSCETYYARATVSFPDENNDEDFDATYDDGYSLTELLNQYNNGKVVKLILKYFDETRGDTYYFELDLEYRRHEKIARDTYYPLMFSGFVDEQPIYATAYEDNTIQGGISRFCPDITSKDLEDLVNTNSIQEGVVTESKLSTEVQNKLNSTADGDLFLVKVNCVQTDSGFTATLDNVTYNDIITAHNSGKHIEVVVYLGDAYVYGQAHCFNTNSICADCVVDNIFAELTINSDDTCTLTVQPNYFATTTALTNGLSGKQDTITDGSITENQLSTDVQAKLGSGGDVYIFKVNISYDSQTQGLVASYVDGYSYDAVIQNINDGKALCCYVSTGFGSPALFSYYGGDYNGNGFKYEFRLVHGFDYQSITLNYDGTISLSGFINLSKLSVETDYISNYAVTEEKLSSSVQAKLNATGSGSVDLSNYATKTELASKLDTTTASTLYATKTALNDKIDTSVANSTFATKTALNGKLDSSTANSTYATKTELNAKQNTLTSGSINNSLLADNSVTSAKIQDGTIALNDLNSTLQAKIPNYTFVVSNTAPTVNDTSVITFVVS